MSIFSLVGINQAHSVCERSGTRAESKAEGECPANNPPLSSNLSDIKTSMMQPNINVRWTPATFEPAQKAQNQRSAIWKGPFSSTSLGSKAAR